MSDPLLLIDGDVFLYNATLAAEYEMWSEDDDTHVLKSSFAEAHQGFLNQITFVQNKFNTEKVRIAFTKGDTFRHEIYPAYKSNRTSKRKPLCFTRLRDTIEKDFKCLSIPGLEADDILGIWATRDANQDPIIVSADKDLKTIPGKLWRQNELLEITEAEADYFWLTQTLTGDVTDGYPGCPGAGPKKAERIIKLDLPVIRSQRVLTKDVLMVTWASIVGAYEDAGLTADDALTQARLARILRASDWDAKNKQPILWSP
jgi:DNA polymerase-1